MLTDCSTRRYFVLTADRLHWLKRKSAHSDLLHSDSLALTDVSSVTGGGALSHTGVEFGSEFRVWASSGAEKR